MATRAHDLRAFDAPALQAQFVRARGGLSEAFLLVDGIRCGGCAATIERLARAVGGVTEAELDYANHRLHLTWDPQHGCLSDVLQALAEAGYPAQPHSPLLREKLLEDAPRRSVERLIFALAVGMLVMQFALVTYLLEAGQPPLPDWVVVGRWTSAALTLALLVYPGQDFFVGALRALRNRRVGMDLPVALGLSIAFLGSLVATWQRHGDVYYDGIAMLIAFLLVARRWEYHGRVLAARALDRLTLIAPRWVERVSAEGTERVLASDVGPGDRVRVRQGDAVPVDGVIRTGASAFDEALVTGESAPVERGTGSHVMAGAINRGQTVIIEASTTPDESSLARLQQLLHRASAYKPPLPSLADAAARWFVLAVLILAGATAVVWAALDPARALATTVAVLIVTCPCALALAAPVAMTLSAGRLSALGAVPVEMGAFEVLAKARTFVFDKTGTLTTGQPSLEAVICEGGLDERSALAIAAALEREAAHPIARAVLAVCDDEPPEAHACTVEPAQGVSGVISGERWRLGTPEFALGGGDQKMMPAVGDLGGSMVVVLAGERGGRAWLTFNETLRPGAHELVQRLRALGVDHLALLSGDRPERVAALGRALGFDEVCGAQTPDDKLRWMRARQALGERVVMVGDGLNDAPVLAAADASLSFDHAPDLSQLQSDFVLRGDSLDTLVAVRALSQRTRRIVLQNLVWAAGYNITAVPAAALGLLAPWAAAIGMSASSLIVVANSLRLRRSRRSGILPRC